MAANLKLLGPDLPQDFVISVDPSVAILQVKEAALAKWPAGQQPPTLQQLRIIHQGRFLADDKTLKECRIPETETTAMHLIIKALDAKSADAPCATDEKTPKCTCIIS